MNDASIVVPPRFGVILADPPWTYRDFGHSRRIDKQYSVMSTADIRKLNVPRLCLPDCVLFLWSTVPHLPDSLEVLSAWGFTYRSGAVWDKQLIGMGHYFRVQHELLHIGVRGKPPAPAVHDISSVISARRGAHSVKPDKVYVAIERMYPDLPKLELFARKRRSGWVSWGNQLEPAESMSEPEHAANTDGTIAVNDGQQLEQDDSNQ